MKRILQPAMMILSFSLLAAFANADTSQPQTTLVCRNGNLESVTIQKQFFSCDKTGGARNCFMMGSYYTAVVQWTGQGHDLNQQTFNVLPTTDGFVDGQTQGQQFDLLVTGQNGQLRVTRTDAGPVDASLDCQAVSN